MPPFTGDRPTLPELQHFPVKDGYNDIVSEIANDYQNFGILLLNDENGDKVANIKSAQLQNPVAITREILRQWLHGSGRLPVTWQILVECLREAKLNTAAGYIVDALLQEGRDRYHDFNPKNVTNLQVSISIFSENHASLAFQHLSESDYKSII